MKLRGLLHTIAKIGPSLLRLIGVKKGTVADKVAEGAQILDQAIPPEPSPTKKG